MPDFHQASEPPFASIAGFLTGPRLARACAALLALEIAVFLFLIAGTHGWIVPLERATTTDFASFYAAGKLAAAGTPALAYDQAAHHAMEQAVTAPGIEYQFFNYPPVYLLLCAGLAQLPYLAAFVLFIAATFAFYLAVARRILGDRSPAAIVVLLSFPMVFWTMGLGQNAFLTAALFGLATVLLESRPIAAGILFGLLCYKPHFGVLVPIALAAGGYWRSFLAAGCSAAALVLISLALFGWETWQAFLVTAGAAHSVYESGRILFAGFATPFGAVRLLGGPVALAYAVQGLASLVAAPVAIFYDLMLGTIAVCWLMRDESPALTPAEKTFFAAITVLLLDVRHLGESWHLPVAATATLGLFAIVTARAFRELAPQDLAWSWWPKRYAA